MSAVLTVVGRLGSDMEVRATAGGKEFVTFDVACQVPGMEDALWVRCTYFNTKIIEYFGVGGSILVTGTPRMYHSEDAGKSYLQMTVNSWAFVPGAKSRRDDNGNGQGNGQGKHTRSRWADRGHK